METKLRLTEFTKGGGCGCKIPPATLGDILQGQFASDEFGLIVGNSGGDDAAVVELSNGTCLISTTDFFTPIVDDPFDFGRIAAANSISDIYAMGGTPVLAVSILAWPTEKLPAEIAAEVIRGARTVCAEAGIAIGGGHSIENPEPVFGLAVNGIIDRKNIKQNNTVRIGDALYLTKALGSGILTTAMKRGMLSIEQINYLTQELIKINKVGEKLGNLDYVHAITDVTGFGLIGHLIEMTNQSGVTAEIEYSTIPLFDDVKQFASQFIYADNTMRNWKAYNEKVEGVVGESLLTLCDPQTNGGLLVAIKENKTEEFEELMRAEDHFFARIGKISSPSDKQIRIK